MRISDWSSDVCSSDLTQIEDRYRYREEDHRPAGCGGEAKLLIAERDPIEINGEDLRHPCRPALGQQPHFREDSEGKDVAEEQRDQDGRHQQPEGDMAEDLERGPAIEPGRLVEVVGDAKACRIEADEGERQGLPWTNANDE